MKKQLKKELTKKQIQKAVQQSSKIEGISFFRAKKNKKVIQKLKKYGRAFSV